MSDSAHKDVKKIRGMSKYLKFVIFLIVLVLYAILLRYLYIWNSGSDVDKPNAKYLENKKKQMREEERKEREKERRRNERKRNSVK